jgi:hypothetical protein
VAGAGVLHHRGRAAARAAILLNERRRALHGALRADAEGPRPARLRRALAWTRRSRKAAAAGPNKRLRLLDAAITSAPRRS